LSWAALLEWPLAEVELAEWWLWFVELWPSLRRSERVQM